MGRALSYLLAVVLMVPFSVQATELRPIVADGYDHDRWHTEPADIMRVFEGYMVSFDSKDDDNGDHEADVMRVPEWVAQEIRAWDIDASPCIPTGERPSTWITDAELYRSGVAANDESYAFSRDFRATHAEWFERGHMAMKLLVERLGEDAAWNTHTVLNAVPQRATFNKGIWQSLEYLTGAWAQEYGAVWVVQGPVFYDNEPLAWLGEDGDRLVAIPDAIFKIVARDRTVEEKLAAPAYADLPVVLAFLYPQIGPGYFGPSNDYRHERFLTSVDEIEQLTGLDFFTTLSASQQRTIERVRADVLWSPDVVDLGNQELFIPACRRE